MFGTHDPWAVSEADFPRDGLVRDWLRFAVRYAVLAPSSHNSQPWLFHFDGATLELYADRTRALPIADPHDRELVMSCGAVLFHLRVALWHFGHRPRVLLRATANGVASSYLNQPVEVPECRAMLAADLGLGFVPQLVL